MAEKVICDICGKEFSSERGLKIHKSKTHNKKGKKEKEEVKSKTGKIITVPLSKVKFKASRKKRVPRIIKFLKEFLAKHMKINKNSILIGKEVNELIWSKGIEKAPSKVKVLVNKEENTLKVSLP